MIKGITMSTDRNIIYQAGQHKFEKGASFFKTEVFPLSIASEIKA